MYILCTEYIYVEHSLPECSTLFIPSLWVIQKRDRLASAIAV